MTHFFAIWIRVCQKIAPWRVLERFSGVIESFTNVLKLSTAWCAIKKYRPTLYVARVAEIFFFVGIFGGGAVEFFSILLFVQSCERRNIPFYRDKNKNLGGGSCAEWWRFTNVNRIRYCSSHGLGTRGGEKKENWATKYNYIRRHWKISLFKVTLFFIRLKIING